MGGVTNIGGIGSRPLEAPSPGAAAARATKELAEVLSSATNLVPKSAPVGVGKPKDGGEKTLDLDGYSAELVGDVDLVKLVGMLKVASDVKDLETFRKKLDQQMKALDPVHAKRMKDVDKSIKDAAKAARARRLMMIFAIFGALVGVVTGGATFAVLGGAVGVVALIGAGLGVLNAALAVSGGDRAIIKKIADLIEKNHPGLTRAECEKRAGIVYMAVGIAVALATMVGGGVAAFRQASQNTFKGFAAKLLEKGTCEALAKGSQIVNVLPQATQFGGNINSTVANTRASKSKADVEDDKALLRRIQHLLEDRTNDIEDLVMKLSSTVSIMLDAMDSHASQMNALAGNMGGRSI